MDPRQPPQHPFSRNTASPYGRNPFPPSANPPPFSTSSHASNSIPSYADHQRRPSDPPYGGQQRGYPQDGPAVSGSNHSRHQSASSVGFANSNRGMPPPSSPQQQNSHTYGPLPPRAPPVTVGPPTSFPTHRELPSLNSLGRPPSTTGSSMSIHSILGGPTPASREQPPYTSPVNTSVSQPGYSGAAHASPRMASTGIDYAPFRRPQTPEQRGYEPRNNRANSAGSPTGVGNFGTPDTRRYGTPQTYPQRPPIEERRDPPPPRVPNTAMPARPNSQPNFSAPPSRVPDRAPTHGENVYGRRESARQEPSGRPDPAYQRQAEYEERQNAMYAYEQRARQEREREALIQREVRDREQREQQLERDRAINERNSNLQQEYAHQLAQRNQQNTYNRPAETREQPSWMRPGYEPPPRPAYEPIPEQDREPPRQPNAYPGTTAPQYGSHPAYAPGEPRYQPSHASSSMPPQHTPVPASQYESTAHERQRLAQQQEHQRQQNLYGGPPQNLQYQSQDSPTRRTLEESQQMQQSRSFLGVGEINRKGRVSPLPQAVQGAQGQLSGPAHEPGIKSEFGRMFSGIGSGVSAMGAPSPVAAAAQGVPFSVPGPLRRDDMDQDSPVDARGIQRTASSRRRKLKDEDSRDDESSTGRNTPSGRGKRSKTGHHHHGGHHHHHHHHPPDVTSSPSQTPFKSVKGTAVPSPPGTESKANPALHHHHNVPRNHHHATSAKPIPVSNPVIPLAKLTIRSQEVLNYVKDKPRKHLGFAYYKSVLKPSRRSVLEKDDRGFASTAEPLPRFEGSENCTFTIKVPRVYLEDVSRSEITSRRAVFGTDVYTDDSDVVAACIHQGWFRGSWAKDIDVDLLGLEIESSTNGAVNGKDYENDIVTEPPARGPMHVPAKKDLHVTVLILPVLEKYASTTRFGIKSREWGGRHDGYQGIHDGLSFMIMSIQWVDGIDGNDGRTGGARRKIMAEVLGDTEMEAEQAWGDLLANGNGASAPEAHAEESFERGGGGMAGIELPGDIKGTKNWWKKPDGQDGGMKETEREAEADEAADKDREILKVTERMIENASGVIPKGGKEDDSLEEDRTGDDVTAAV